MRVGPLTLAAAVALLAGQSAPLLASPELPAVAAAMQEMVDSHEIAGAVTLVAGKDNMLHLGTTGLADIAAKRPMRPDTMFWIASMTKPVTSVAILMLQDDGRLSVDDPVAKYLPEFAGLRTPSGKPANITIAQLLSHTSGLASPRKTAASRSAKTLRDLAAIYLSSPMQFEPGSSWAYTTSGFVVLGLIVETVAAQPFDAFLQNRLFDPLGMKDTTFYPTDEQRLRLARAYRANPESGVLTAQEGIWSGGPDPKRGDCVPLGDGGLFSTAGDYARFCQMLLGGGTFEGRRYLSPGALRALTTVCTGDLPTGYSKRKLNHVLGWGLGVAIVRAPADGVSAWLSRGSFGHPGAWGTAAWIDPVKGAAYVMMVQRPNMPDNFENPPALAFIRAASGAVASPDH